MSNVDTLCENLCLALCANVFRQALESNDLARMTRAGAEVCERVPSFVALFAPIAEKHAPGNVNAEAVIDALRARYVK
jgi:hypothetical protein